MNYPLGAVKAPRRMLAFTLIELIVVIGIIGVLMGLTLAGLQAVRSAYLRLSCQNNLRQLGVALHQYQDFATSLPPGIAHPAFRQPNRRYGPDSDPYPLLHWHARLLPFIEQNSLWAATQQAYAEDKYSLNDPPHVGHHTAIMTFVCPADGLRHWGALPGRRPPASTSYLGVSGTTKDREDGVFFLDSRILFTEIQDGLSNTLLVGERPPSVALPAIGAWYGGWGPWRNFTAFLGVGETDIATTGLPCSPGPYQFAPDRLTNPCFIFHYWSLHPGGANFAFADGSARFLTYDAAPIMPALATRAGGETATTGN